MNSTRRRLLQLSLAIAGTVFATVVQSQPAKREVRIQVKRFADETDTLIWTSYGISLAAWTSENLDSSKVPEGIFQPSFAAEVAARQSQLKIWAELTEKEPKTNTYIEAVALASNAGFLREYVWSFHWVAEWGTPPADLRLSEFEEWRMTHLQRHKPTTGAALSFGPKVVR